MAVSIFIADTLIDSEKFDFAEWMLGTRCGFDKAAQKEVADWCAQTRALIGSDSDAVGLSSSNARRVVRFLRERDWRIPTEFQSPAYPIDVYLADRLAKFIR